MKSSPALVDQGQLSDKNVLWSSWRAILHRGGRALLRGGHHFDRSPSYSIGIVPKYSLSEPQIFCVGKNIFFCQLVYKGPFGDWHEERLCNATDFLKDGQLEYQEYQVDVERRRLLLEAPKWNNSPPGGVGGRRRGRGGQLQVRQRLRPGRRSRHSLHVCRYLFHSKCLGF